MLVSHGTLTLTLTAVEIVHKEWRTGPCNTPLFRDDYRVSGVCRGCDRFWSVNGSRPTPVGIETITAARQARIVAGFRSARIARMTSPAAIEITVRALAALLGGSE